MPPGRNPGHTEFTDFLRMKRVLVGRDVLRRKFLWKAQFFVARFMQRQQSVCLDGECFDALRVEISGAELLQIFRRNADNASPELA